MNKKHARINPLTTIALGTKRRKDSELTEFEYAQAVATPTELCILFFYKQRNPIALLTPLLPIFCPTYGACWSYCYILH